MRRGAVSRWLVVETGGKASENYELTLTQVGHRLDGNGRVRIGSAYDLTVRLELADGGQLLGVVAMHGGHAFPASISLY